MPRNFGALDVLSEGVLFAVHLTYANAPSSNWREQNWSWRRGCTGWTLRARIPPGFGRVKQMESPGAKTNVKGRNIKDCALYWVKSDQNEHRFLYQERVIRLMRFFYLKATYLNSSCYHDLKSHEVSATGAVATPRQSGEPHG